jgi:hypothetical protein
MGSNVEVLQKLKTELLHNTMMPLLRIYLQECAPGYNRTTCANFFIATLFTIANLWKHPRCLMTDEWIKNM